MKQVLITIESLVLRSPFRRSINQPKMFSMYNSVLLLAGISLLVSSCQKEELITSSQKEELQTTFQKQDLMNSVQNENLRKKTVPFKADFTVTQEVIQAPAPGTPLIFLATATGNASHMGKTAYEAKVTIDVFAKPVLATDITTLTAANGDQIFLNSIGVVPDPDANGNTIVILTSTITGGTGRFANASGTLTATTGSSPTNTIHFEGMISY